MIAVDSSVAIAAFGDWHALNEPARQVLDAGAAIPAHALLETYSVLTAFPPPHRARPTVVDQWLDARFAGILTPPGPEALRRLVHRLASAGFIGGTTYDALVALTVAQADAVLVTADTRAATVYDFVGVEVRNLVAP
ncbi:MAG: PIN domain-containing protein [Actinomycetota bacterium]|nr:PIN domain-containing protein [Actinomycetota bacterium]